MKLIFVLIFTSIQTFAVNRPYTEVIDELVSESCEKKKENLFLEKDIIKKIEEKSEVKIYGGLALRYVETCGDEKIYHYVDSHIVRTLNETVVITIKEDKVASFKVASFGEPAEYKAPNKWYHQFAGYAGDKLLKGNVNVDVLSGATLTVNSSVSAVNKIMVMHKLLKR